MVQLSLVVVSTSKKQKKVKLQCTIVVEGTEGHCERGNGEKKYFKWRKGGRKGRKKMIKMEKGGGNRERSERKGRKKCTLEPKNQGESNYAKEIAQNGLLKITQKGTKMG